MFSEQFTGIVETFISMYMCLHTVTLAHPGRTLDEVVDGGVREAEEVRALALRVDHLGSQAAVDLLQQLRVALVDGEASNHVKICVGHNFKPVTLDFSLTSHSRSSCGDLEQTISK